MQFSFSSSPQREVLSNSTSMMSIQHLAIKTNCVIWKNIQLPHPHKNRTSDAFCFDKFRLHFRVTCTWSSGEERFKFEILHPSVTNFPYSVTPFMESADKSYHRLSMDVRRSSFPNMRADHDIITVLFAFEPCTMSKPLIIKGNNLSDESMHLESLSSHIYQLFNNDEYADATLTCGDRSFHVHRNILSARSEVFSAMFKADMSEKRSGTVNITDLEPNILEQFLTYLYSGDVEEMSMDSVFELYKIAEKYAVFTLKKLCASYILDNMTNDIVCKVLLFANESGDTELLDGASAFAVNIGEFIKSAEWKDFAENFPGVAVKVYFKYFK